MIIMLKDVETLDTDAVIITKTTTADEIQDIIDTVKTELEGEWQFDDIADRLPDDCEIHTVWAIDELATVYY